VHLPRLATCPETVKLARRQPGVYTDGHADHCDNNRDDGQIEHENSPFDSTYPILQIGYDNLESDVLEVRLDGVPVFTLGPYHFDGAIDEEVLVKEPLDLNLGSYRDLRLQSAFGYDGHMTEMTVELPDDLAERIQMRAQAEGRSLSEVIAEALGTVLDENPFEFVAAFGSTEVTGASADAYLRRENFGE